MAGIHEGDFYEEDEPIEDILAAWERGEIVLTSPPGTLATFITASFNTGGASIEFPSMFGFEMANIASWMTDEDAPIHTLRDPAVA